MTLAPLRLRISQHPEPRHNSSSERKVASSSLPGRTRLDHALNHTNHSGGAEIEGVPVGTIAARWPDGLDTIEAFIAELNSHNFALDREAVLRLTGLLSGVGAHAIELIGRHMTGDVNARLATLSVSSLPCILRTRARGNAGWYSI
jgi:hypothetical protein